MENNKVPRRSKKHTPAFGFRIKKNDGSLPVFITWMPHCIQKISICFGDVIFLDTQKRQYNEWEFPYYTFTMVDYDNTVAMSSGTIYTEEMHDGYRQMIQNTQKLEPRWK